MMDSICEYGYIILFIMHLDPISLAIDEENHNQYKNS